MRDGLIDLENSRAGFRAEQIWFRVSNRRRLRLVRQADSQLILAKFDGHDSYQLMLTFEPPLNQTTLLVVLKSFPD